MMSEDAQRQEALPKRDQDATRSPLAAAGKGASAPGKRSKLSRRQVVTGGITATALLAAGWGAWFYVAHQIPLFTYRGHTDSVNSVAWSPDGKRIASASDDKTVQVWNATDGSTLFTYHGHTDNEVVAVAWSPDGKRIASSDGLTVDVWNATDGSAPFTYYHELTGSMNTVVWSPDGEHIAWADDNTVNVWNVPNGGFLGILK